MRQKVLNATAMKQQNEKKVLDQIRIRPIPRIDIARNIGLTRAAVSVIAEQLISKGILMEGLPVQGKKGRNSIELTFNPDKFYLIGIDIARDYCTIGIADFAGQIKSTHKFVINEQARDVQDILEEISLCLEKLLQDNPCQGDLLGIGITAPGPMDVRAGTILNPPNFMAWHNLPIVEYFEQRFSCFVTLENNARALTLAETYYGIGSQSPNYIGMVVDTGIGGGIMVNGNLYESEHGFSADFGHVSIDINGEQCSCGNWGCAELYASIPNILKEAKKLDKSLINWVEVVKKAEAGEAKALQIIDLEARYLASIITSIVNIFAIGTIITMGDITYHGGLINERIEKIVNQQFIGRTISTVSVCSSKMPEHANVLA